MCITCVNCGQQILRQGLVGRNPFRCDLCKKTAKNKSRRGKYAKSKLRHSLACLHCQQSFTSDRKKQKYCCPQCRWLASRKTVWLLCENRQCRKQFETRPSLAANGHRFCCRECSYPEKHICQNPSCKKAFRPKYKVANKPWQGKGLYCCRECYADHRFGVNRPRRKSAQKIVSASARSALITSLRKKCKLLSVPHDPECTREAVCERDNWVCQMCGIKCDKEHLGTNKKPKPTAAEHDHMIALTTPGSPGNVFPNSQCLCRKCNNRKRTRSWGQRRFDFEESGKRWENGARGRRQRNSKSCEEIPASAV